MITALDPFEQNVTEPNIAEFVCNATARPRPTITWYTDDGMSRALLIDSVNATIMEQETGDRELTSTLAISPTAPSDATYYVCVAENVVDTDEMTSNLTIHGTFISFYHCLHIGTYSCMLHCWLVDANCCYTV